MTAKRILREAGLSKAAALAPPKAYFPQPTPIEVFAFHTIDCQTRALKQTLASDKTTATVRAHALKVWKTLGVPEPT